jgi:hypothetical protein
MFVAVFELVLVRVFNRVRRNGHYEAPVLHAFEADEQIRKLGNLSRFAMHDQYF